MRKQNISNAVVNVNENDVNTENSTECKHNGMCRPGDRLSEHYYTNKYDNRYVLGRPLMEQYTTIQILNKESV